MNLASEHPPLFLEVDGVPRSEGPAPVEDDRTTTRRDRTHQLDAPWAADVAARSTSGTTESPPCGPRTSATTASTIWSTGTSRRWPVARSLISIVPDSRPLPTMTMVGTPISSASLNFTPGETFRDELEAEEVRAVDLFEAVNRPDAGVIERRENVGLTRESQEAFGVLGERFGENFQGDLALEARVARAPNLSHASRPERAENLV